MPTHDPLSPRDFLPGIVVFGPGDHPFVRIKRADLDRFESERGRSVQWDDEDDHALLIPVDKKGGRAYSWGHGVLLEKKDGRFVQSSTRALEIGPRAVGQIDDAATRIYAHHISPDRKHAAMNPIGVARDPFARGEYRREHAGSGSCSWCGQERKTLYTYGWDSDGGRYSGPARGRFCGLPCFRAYHDVRANPEHDRAPPRLVRFSGGRTCAPESKCPYCNGPMGWGKLTSSGEDVWGCIDPTWTSCSYYYARPVEDDRPRRANPGKLVPKVATSAGFSVQRISGRWQPVRPDGSVAFDDRLGINVDRGGYDTWRGAKDAAVEMAENMAPPRVVRPNPHLILVTGNPAPGTVEKAWCKFHQRDVYDGRTESFGTIKGMPPFVFALGKCRNVEIDGAARAFKPQPWLVCSPDDDSLWIVTKDVMNLGSGAAGRSVEAITYDPPAESGKQPAYYRHEFSRPLPSLTPVGDPHRCRAVLLDGGDYKVTDWIHD